MSITSFQSTKLTPAVWWLSSHGHPSFHPPPSCYVPSVEAIFFFFLVKRNKKPNDVQLELKQKCCNLRVEGMQHVCMRTCFFIIILNDYDCHCSTPCHLRNYVWSDINWKLPVLFVLWLYVYVCLRYYLSECVRFI